MFRLSFMFIVLLTAGCVSLDPHYDRPAAPVPATLPGAHGESTAVVGDWQKVVNDARLKSGQHRAEQQPRCAKGAGRYRGRARPVWRNAGIAVSHR